MCGIAGFVANRELKLAAQPVLDSLRHRGPDDRGVVTWTPGTPLRLVQSDAGLIQAHAALFHTRLSVIDTSTASCQPMLTSTGTAAIAYNGEVYNYRELRRELEALGRRFRTIGDTEVVLAAWEQWGVKAFIRFEGMFALAILDSQARRLLLARDIAGVKPLYFTYDQSGVYFASEAHALRNISNIGGEIDDRSVIEFVGLGLTDHDGRSFRRGVYHFRRGHVAEIQLDAPTCPEQVAFWHCPDRGRAGGFKKSVALVRELFLDSIKLHLRSDVPIGVTLSGGIDSSAVLCGARQVLGREGSLTAFFYQAEEEALNERRWAEAAAKAAGAALRTVRLEGSPMFADLERLVVLQDEPFNSSSIYPQYLLFKRMREDGIKVSLGGQGADELFFGYPKILERLGRLAARRGNAVQAMRYYFLAVSGGGAQLNHPEFWSMLGDAVQKRNHLKAIEVALLGNKRAPYLGLRYQSVVEHAPDLAYRRESLVSDIEREIRELFFQSSLPRLLRYEDRNAMYWSIENRVPFCTKSLVEAAFSLPVGSLLSPLGVTKRVLRAALRGIVPDIILNRRDRIGFFTPEASLVLNSSGFVTQLFNEFPADWLPQIDFTSMRKTWRDISEGRAPYRPVVWRWISVCLWARALREQPSKLPH